MQYEQFGEHYVLKLDPNEELRTALLQFVNQEDVRGGYFMAFGAFSKVRLRYFDPKSKRYEDRDVNQQVEVVSLLGNIARQNGRPMLHIHAAVADDQMRTYSGHIGEATVRPTLEVFLTKFPGEIRREKDPDTGLDVLALNPMPPTGRQKAA